MPRLSGALAGAFLAMAACAAHAGPAQPGEEKGLGLLPHDLPEALKKAQANPYAPPDEPVCASIDSELAALEKVLGPDVDAVQPKENKAAGLIGDAVRGAIPYRGWIRKITGAERADKKRDKAMLAGWERRGYLKGLARQKRCLLPEPETAAAAPGTQTEAPPTEALAAESAAGAGVAAAGTAPVAEAEASAAPEIGPPIPLPPAMPAEPAYAPAYPAQGDPAGVPAPAEAPAYAPPPQGGR